MFFPLQVCAVKAVNKSTGIYIMVDEDPSQDEASSKQFPVTRILSEISMDRCTPSCTADIASEADPEKHDVSDEQCHANSRFSLMGLLRFFGAGFLSAVAFLDPGNLEADINVG